LWTLKTKPIKESEKAVTNKASLAGSELVPPAILGDAAGDLKDLGIVALATLETLLEFSL